MISEDLDIYLDAFGTDMTPDGADPVRVVFTEGVGTVEDGEYRVETRGAVAEGKTTDLSGFKPGAAMQANGRNWVVSAPPRPDPHNPNWTHLLLERA